MSEVSPGERALLRFRWLVSDAGSRPVAVAGVLAILAAVAAMAAALSGASSVFFGSVRWWVFYAADGFRTDVQLGLLVATVLLVIDAQSGDGFPGQRVVFAVIMILSSVGVVANVTAIVAWLSEVGIRPLAVGSTAEAWAIILASYLAPAVLAAVSGWVAVTAVRSTQRHVRA